MNWALIGASTIAAQYMISAIRAQKENKIVWVVSGSEERAKSFALKHNIKYWGSNLKTALSDSQVNAVYISSTNEKHFSQAMSAIAEKKHVLCEKPLALTLEDSITMVKAASSQDLIFATNHHLRCSGSHQKIRELIKDGSIGEVLSMRIFHAVLLPTNLHGWRTKSAASGGGVIPDITVHNADVIRFLLDEDPLTVMGQTTTSSLSVGVEDSAMSVWTMPSGIMVMSHESFTHEFAGSGLEVHGTTGSIFASKVMSQKPIGNVKLITSDGEKVLPFSKHDLYTYGVSQFLGAINKQKQAAASGWDGIKSLAVALAVRESAKSGKRVNVQYKF